MNRRLVSSAAVWTLAALPAAAVPFKVVVPIDHPQVEVSRAQLSKIFLRKLPQWDDGTPARPIDLAVGSPLRDAFSQSIHGRSASDVVSYWQRRTFSGAAAPPVAGSASEVLLHLAREPGSVGYLAADAPLDASVRILAVSDLAGYDAAELVAGSAAAGDGAAAGLPAGDRRELTVSRHGDLHLFLAGSCGRDAEGREAILENSDPYRALSARIETSIWDDGWFRSSSVSLHKVSPESETRLGCTRPSGDLERRYKIVEVSSAASHHGLAHVPDGPPRSVVDIVGSGTCGRGSHGSWRSVLNRHPRKTVAVSIRTVETVDGKVRRRFLKSHRLPPGATARLGCSRDGDLVRTFSLAEAEYH